MDPLLVYTISSTMVVVTLCVSLLFWLRIKDKTKGDAQMAARLFAICFLFYAVGQSWIIFQVLKTVPVSTIPSYLNAISAFIFAIGSYYQMKSLK